MRSNYTELSLYLLLHLLDWHPQRLVVVVPKIEHNPIFLVLENLVKTEAIDNSAHVDVNLFLISFEGELLIFDSGV
jgi:hypothetical protein